LAALAETAQQYDTDGIDIYFLNNKKESLNIKVSSIVQVANCRFEPVAVVFLGGTGSIRQSETFGRDPYWRATRSDLEAALS
jgi:hypothetical protein